MVLVGDAEAAIDSTGIELLDRVDFKDSDGLGKDPFNCSADNKGLNLDSATESVSFDIFDTVDDEDIESDVVDNLVD